MGHGITSSDNFGEIRTNGKRAWHRLGEEIPEGLSAVEGFERIGLDWTTELVPMRADFNGQEILIPGKLAQLRSDNSELLGIVSEGWESVENMELARFADSLSSIEGGVDVETCGSLNGGKRVFALVKLPEVADIVGDAVERYLLVSNGHGGTAAFCAYPTFVRVVCNNTLTLSERDLSKGIRFLHVGSSSMDQRVKLARTALGFAREEMSRFEDKARAMATTRINDANALTVLAEIYDATFGSIGDDVVGETRETLTAKRAAVLAQWSANFFEDARQDTDASRGTLWGLFNSVTQWHDHERGRLKVGGMARTGSNLFGTSNRDKGKALRAISKQLARI